MNKEIILDNDIYIQENHLTQMFELGEYHKVDKIRCGNGVSSSFLKTVPPEGKINIMIAPNKGVVADKEEQYRIRTLDNPNQNKIMFFYGDGEDVFITEDALECQVLVFVADSFLLMRDKLNELASKIYWVLLDESHKLIEEASFRNILKGFDTTVVRMFPNAAISAVTASPKIYEETHVDVINKKYYEDNPERIEVRVTANHRSAVEKINDILKDTEDNVIVATNDIAVIYNFTDRNKRKLEANYRIGGSLMSNVVIRLEVVHNPDAKLTILSSTSFEGYDYMKKDAHFYFFENRQKQHTTFSIANLYQAMSRARLGCVKYNYVRINSDTITDEPVIENEDGLKIPMVLFRKANKLIEGVDVSFGKKLTERAKDKELRECTVLSGDTIELYNNYFINLAENNDWSRIKLKQDMNNNIRIKQFWEKRNVVFNTRDYHKNIQLTQLRNDIRTTIKYLKLNKDFISDKGLFDKLKLEPIIYNGYGEITREKASKWVKEYIMKKECISGWQPNDRLKNVQEIIDNETLFNEVVKEQVKIYRKHLNDKGESRRKIVSKVDDFKKTLEKLVISILLALGNDRIFAAKKIRAYRDFNIFTELNMNGIRAICKEVGVTVDEFDISSCNPRIIYALNGLKLPENFYGKDKGNKKAINVLLNDLKHKRLRDAHSVDAVKEVREKSLVNLGFKDSVAKYLVDKYAENFEDALYHDCTKVEEEIIEQFREYFKEELNIGTVRRHDSLLVFDNKGEIDWVDKFEYGGFTGWFK